MTATYDASLECQLLSCILKDGNSFYEVQDWVTPETFYNMFNPVIWKAFQEIANNDLFIDKHTLIAQLDKSNKLQNYIPFLGAPTGRDAIEYLLSLDANVEAAESYAKQLNEIKNIRDIVKLKDEVALMTTQEGKPSAEILSHLDIEAGKISGNSGAILSSIKTFKDVLKESAEVVISAINGESKYIETGIDAIDEFTGGGLPGGLYIIAGASGDGKSATGIDIAYNVALDEKYLKGKDRKRHKVGFINLEMKPVENFHRIIQRITGIDPIRLAKGKLTEKEVGLYQETMKKLNKIEGNPILFENAPEIDISQLRQKIRKMKAEGCDIFFVDQLQQIRPSNSMASLGRHVIYDFISYRIKAFAREFDVPIFLMHQLNRSADNPQNKNAELNLTNLNEGGERAADSVIFIRHVKKNQEIISSSFHHVKNRHGRTGSKPVKFTGQFLLFEDVPEGYIPPSEEIQDEPI